MKRIKSKKNDQDEKDESKKIEVIRPELNLEKWSIWQPAQSRSKLSEIIISRKSTQDDGSKASAEVEVTSNSKYGALTTDTQKVYYALVKIWERQGRPRRFFFSLRAIARELKKEWGQNVREAIEKALYQLRFTAFIWRNSYFNSVTKEKMRELRAFTILSDLYITERKEDNYVTLEACYAEFYELIYQNLLNNYSKPLLFDTILQFEDGIAQILYTHLDLILYDKDHYERNTEELFSNDLQLKSDEYKYPSCRKRTLERIIPKFKDKPLSTGYLIELAVKKTKDETDYKLVVDKTGQRVFTDIWEESKKPISNSEIEAPASTLVNEEEFVLYFIKIFGLKRAPLPRELQQAKQLTLDYQLNQKQAFHFVEFSRAEASKTRFLVANFGGIVAFIDSALNDFEGKQAAKKREEAVKNCLFCKGTSGLLIFDLQTKPDPSERYRRNTFSEKCPHSEEKIREIEKRTNSKVSVTWELENEKVENIFNTCPLCRKTGGKIHARKIGSNSLTAEAMTDCLHNQHSNQFWAKERGLEII